MADHGFDLPLPDVDEAGPYALMGTARARPDQADALEHHLVSLVTPTRREPGALAYHVYRDRFDPTLFVFYEAWSSRDALLAHLGQPYIQAFLANRQDYLVGDLEIRWLTMSSPYSTPVA